MATQPCSYHSTNPSVWECDECIRSFCDSCIVVIDEPGTATAPRCPLCENWLIFLGTGHQARPFWTVAHTLFAYPFSGSGIALLVLAAGLGFLISAGIFALPAFIFLCAVLARYGIAVTTHIANGSPGTPSLQEALESDEDHIFWKFTALLLAVAAVQITTTVLVSPTLGTVVSVVSVVLLPAMIVQLAAERQLSSVFQPLRLIWLISRIGWPYVLVVFLSTVLAGGPMLLLGTIGDSLAAPLIFPVLAASFAYFGVVNFCMLGYVVFEKQSELGFVAGEVADVTIANTPANRMTRLFSEVNVLIREARMPEALKLIKSARSEFRDEPTFYERAMLLALRAKNTELIESLTNGYLQILMSKDALDQALDCCRKSMVVHTSYRPKSPDIAHTLAERAFSKNLNKDALKLLVNLHKRAPDYAHLGDAYRLAADILRNGMGNDAKARELEAFVVAKGYSQAAKGSSFFSAAKGYW